MKFISLKSEITGKIEFIDYCLPSLRIGKYEIDFTQKASGKGDKAAVDEEFHSQKKEKRKRGGCR